MNEEAEAWLNQQALNYKACLIAVKKNIPQKLDEGLELSAKDLKDIASNLFIQGNRSGVFRAEGDPGPPRYPDDELPSEAQQRFVAVLATELGKEADLVIDQHLRLNGKADVVSLSKQETTELITKLKAEKKMSKK